MKTTDISKLDESELLALASPTDPHFADIVAKSRAASEELARRRQAEAQREQEEKRAQQMKADSKGEERFVEFETIGRDEFNALRAVVRALTLTPFKPLIFFFHAVELLVRQNTWRAALGVLYEHGFFAELVVRNEVTHVPQSIEDLARLRWFEGGEDPREKEWQQRHASSANGGARLGASSQPNSEGPGFFARLFGKTEQ